MEKIRSNMILIRGGDNHGDRVGKRTRRRGAASENYLKSGTGATGGSGGRLTSGGPYSKEESGARKCISNMGRAVTGTEQRRWFMSKYREYVYTERAV